MANSSQAPHNDKPSIAETVAGQLREEIFTSRRQQGEPLREMALAEEMNVSRRTIREALLLLASQRLVVHERNRGAVVRTLDRGDVSDLYQVRRTLELQGARTAPLASERNRDALTRAYESLCEAAHSNDSREIVRADLTFHGAVVGLSSSPRLKGFFQQVAPEMEMALAVIRGGETMGNFTADEVIGDHRTIHDALIARDAMEAQRAILAHIDFNERFLLTLVD